VMIKQSDGTTIPFTGTLPSSAYKEGATVSISFNTYMPNKAYYETTPFSKPADGIYRVALVTQGSGGCCSSTNVGTTSNPVISVNGQTLSGSGTVQSIKMTLVYNYNTDSYSIDTSTTFGTAAYVGSGYRFDSATGELVSCFGATCDPNYSPNPFGDQPRNNFSLTGNADGTEISTSNIGIFDTATGVFSGFFNAVFSGSWNLPTYNSGGATQVPEPGMLTLFAAGALVPVLRRRKAKREGK